MDVARVSSPLLALTLVFSLAGCGGGRETHRFLLQGQGSGQGWTGFTLTIAGHSSPPPADGGAPRYVDIPASEPVAEGALVELRWQTPCGEAVRSFPLPAPRFSDQGVMIVQVPPTLAAPPPRTRVFFPREMRGTVTIGEITLEAPRTAEVADLACAKAATIGGVEVAIPALEPPLAEEERKLHAGGDATTAILVSDDPTACFVDEIVAFGGGEWARSWRRQLTGERVYVLAFPSYEVFFEAIPDEVQVRLGTEGTSRTSLTRCAAL